MQILCPKGGTVATENYHCLHLKITNEQFVHVRKFKPLKKQMWNKPSKIDVPKRLHYVLT